MHSGLVMIRTTQLDRKENEITGAGYCLNSDLWLKVEDYVDSSEC